MHTSDTAKWDGKSDFYEDDEELDDLLEIYDRNEHPVITVEPITAHDVVKYLADERKIQGEMKLMKLCYYSHAEHLLMTRKPLFRETIEAWAAGPVVREVWVERSYRARPAGSAEAVLKNPTARQAIDAAVSRFGRLNGVELSDMSHRERPWLDARRGLKPQEPGNTPITADAILSFYLQLEEMPSDEPSGTVCE